MEDDFKGAKKLMIKIGNKDEMINKKAYETWPLFKKFRKTEEFKSGFYELFDEEFSIEEIQDKKKVEKESELDKEEFLEK